MNSTIKSGVCPDTQKQLYASFFSVSATEIKRFDPVQNLIKVQAKATEDEAAERGIVAGYMSVFDNVDQGGDIIRKGAFRKTLAERRPVVLWQHSLGMPIGQVKEVYEDDIGLYAVISINLKTELGRDAYELVKAGDIGGFSIGYRAEKFDFVVHKDERYGREIKEVKLYEVSIVTLPMNDLAVVTEIKKHVEDALSGVAEEQIEAVKTAETPDEMLVALKAFVEERDRPMIEAIEAVKAFKADREAEQTAELEAIKALRAELFSN